MLKVGILASGGGTDLPAIFEARLEEIEFVALISNKAESGAIEKAKQYGVPHFFVASKDITREEFDQKITDIFKEQGAEIILTVGFMRILSPIFLRNFPQKVFNIHPSLLPAFGGGQDKNVHQAVLDKGCKVSGATIHIVDENVDSGPIVLQDSVKIVHNDDVDSLREKVQIVEQKMLIEFLKLYRDKKIIFENNLIKIIP